MDLYEIYWSPTGGTKKVADAFMKGMGDCEKIDLIKNPDGLEKLELKEDDICLIAAPSYGGRVPETELNLLKKLKGNNARAVVAAVYGNRHIDDTLTDLSDEMKKLGFRVCAGFEAVAEHSLARKFGAGRPDEDDKDELSFFGKKVKTEIESGKISDDAELPGSHDYKIFGGCPVRPSADEDKCIGCGVCAKECPVGAISFDNFCITNNDKCISCMHCIAVCPSGARFVQKEVTAAMEQRLESRCQGRKPNKLYI